MLMKYIKNPIIVSILIGITLMIIFYLIKKEAFETNLKNAIIKYGIISILVSTIAWFCLSSYQENTQVELVKSEVLSNKSSYRPLGGKTLPNDIFLEIAPFG